MPNEMTPLLRVRNLTVEVATARGIGVPVDRVDFDIHAGEIVGLVGESGSGKSMCARSVLQLEADTNVRIANGSSVELRGKELIGLSDREMATVRGSDISMIFQDPSSFLNPVMTIGRQVREAVDSSLDREPAASRVSEILDLVGLPRSMGIEERFAHELSGGMKQRALIAVALAGGPDLLIADEPTTALDVTIQAQVLALLKELQEKLDAAVLLITHDLGVVAQSCDRAYVMYAGSIVEDGPVSKLFREPEHPYTASLLHSALSVYKGGSQTRGSSGDVPDLYSRSNGCSFAPRCSFATDTCRDVRPARVPKDSQGAVSCHHSGDVKADSRVYLQSVLGTGMFQESRAPDEVEAGSDRPLGTESETAPPLLSTGELRKEFPLGREGLLGPRVGLLAVANLNLTIHRGESVALVGESGSGKSTIAKMILGLLSPSSGRIRFDGVDISSMSKGEKREFRRRAQMVFQNPYLSLNPTKAVRQILRQPYVTHRLVAKKDIDDQVAALLESVGLSSTFMNRYPHQLSGGERQRIALARALSLNPDLIVADEPVSALDMSVRAQVLDLMARMRQVEGVSYLLITHELSSAVALTDQVVVLYLGRIVEQGSTIRTFAVPMHPYTRALVAAAPVPDPEVAARGSADILMGEIPSPSAIPAGCVLHPRCPFAQPERCQDEVPELRAVGTGRKVACHYAEDILNGKIQAASDRQSVASS